MLVLSLFFAFLVQHPGTDIHRTIARAAAAQVDVTVEYAPTYERLEYPGGDVPQERGVCADVVVRAFRKIGVDLQKEIYNDKRRDAAAYPNIWNVKTADRNIDHRRVPNLMTYFKRKGKLLPQTSAYEPGDVVAWLLPSGLYHIGIVSEDSVGGTNRNYMIHNIGSGAQKEDVLFQYKILAHYRW